MSDTESGSQDAGPVDEDGMPVFEGQVVFKGAYPEKYEPTPIEEFGTDGE